MLFMTTILVFVIIFVLQCLNPVGRWINKVEFSNAAMTSGWIKTRIVRGQLFLPVTVNGHRVMALLDSGAERTIIPSNLAASLAVRSEHGLRINGYGGPTRGYLGTKINVKIGDMNYMLFHPLISVPPPLVAQTVKLNYHFNYIILGEDVFLKDVVDIDFPKNRIRFTHSPNLKYVAQTTQWPLEIINDDLVVPGKIIGGPAGYFELDTGDNGIFDLFPTNNNIRAWLKKTNFLQKPLRSRETSVGLGGIITSRIIRVKEIKIGKVLLKKIPVVLDSPSNWPRDSNVMGSVGLIMMRANDVVFDYPDRKIFLKPELNHVTMRVHMRLPGDAQNPKSPAPAAKPGDPPSPHQP